jgi:carboxyl-terminal processing protease
MLKFQGGLMQRRVISFFAYFTFFIVAAFRVCAAEEVPLLKHANVRQVMNQLFVYHVDKNKMDEELMARAFQLYLQQLDPEKVYFLQGEINPYIHPSKELLSRSVEEFNNDNLSVFYQINSVAQKAIVRSQAMREQIFINEREEIFKKYKEKFSKESLKEKKRYAVSEGELEKRLKEYIIRFITIQNLEDKELDEVAQEKMFRLYRKRLKGLESGYLFINEEGVEYTPEEKENFIVMRTTKAMAEGLDSHSAYFSPMEAFDMKVRLEKGFFGLGIVLQESIDGIKITRLIEGGPAQESGMVMEKDVIVEIDGQPIEEFSFKRVLNMIRGKEGSNIVLGLERQNGEQKSFVNVVLTRGKVKLNDERVDVSYEAFGDGIIGTIRLFSFYEGEDGVSSERDVRKAIEDLRKVGNLKGLILDLRENTGGFLQQAVRVAGLFITNGVVVVSKYSKGQKHFYRDVDGYSYYDGPMVVLTSKMSASAAEIVAQSLQDYGVALVVGDKKTYGKGSIQHQTITSGVAPSFFKVTVGRYYTVSGRSTQVDGVKADIVVSGIFHDLPIGEEHLDHPLQGGKIADAYSDDLNDIDPIVRHWFKKYYSPTLQKQEKEWRDLLPILSKNSQLRQKKNKLYQKFLEDVSLKDKDKVLVEQGLRKSEKRTYHDYQLQEAIKVVKDMVYLESQPKVNVQLALKGASVSDLD